MKFDAKQMDIENLDELIGKCEDSMVSPFRKKEPEALEGEAEAPMEGEEEAKPDLSDMDLDDLVRMYEELKAKAE